MLKRFNLTFKILLNSVCPGVPSSQIPTPLAVQRNIEKKKKKKKPPVLLKEIKLLMNLMLF